MTEPKSFVLLSSSWPPASRAEAASALQLRTPRPPRACLFLRKSSFLQIGEVYYYGTGTKDQCKGAMGDQFFLGDYLETVEDAEGYVMDLTMEMPVHLRNLLDPLCNAQMEPYPEPYQSAYQSERIRAFGGVEALHGAGLPVPIARLVDGWTVLSGTWYV